DIMRIRYHYRFHTIKNHTVNFRKVESMYPSISPSSPRPFLEYDYPVAFESLTFLEDKQDASPVIHQYKEALVILYIPIGTIHITIESSPLTLTKGQGLFLNQNIHYQVQECETGSQLHILSFHPAVFFGYGEGRLNTKYLLPIITSPQIPYLILQKNKPGISELLKISVLLTNEELHNSSSHFASELKVKSLIGEFFYLLSCHIQKQHSPTARQGYNTYDDHRIQEVLLFIENNYTEDLSLSDLASSMHLSRSECCRSFKRTLGVTPFEYLTKFRIMEAVRKMQKKEADAETISDLATSVGFNSTSYFAKLFKKYMNCTPLEYKKRARSQAEE
ncbi:AraC family transcriptional regulator, partial [Lachnospiraceae bacterium OttesenSCG-928-D06]|nr:AraC family transcriptional regulator [Lachnospiraceae bacterium OttesenSCG-928-D06]